MFSYFSANPNKNHDDFDFCWGFDWGVLFATFDGKLCQEGLEGSFSSSSGQSSPCSLFMFCYQQRLEWLW